MHLQPLFSNRDRLACTQVAQGKVWVFGEGGPQAFIRAAAVKPALIEELQGNYPPRAASGEEWVFFGNEYARDLPYGWATLVENALGAPVSSMTTIFLLACLGPR